MAQSNGQSRLYRVIWRWHFYAGLFIIPMILILSVTGAIYLFKPQIDRWEERAFQRLPVSGAVTPSIQRDAALAAFPEARFLDYRLPERSGDAALIHLELPDRKFSRDVFVSPQGKVVGALDSHLRIMEITKKIHGQLLLGHRGSWLVELAASWAIVLIVAGLYLWWPRNTRMTGVFWPRLDRGRRILLRDIHAVTGFWVAGVALALLLTGLPWADVWGSSFKALRTEMGWVKGKQDWTIGGGPAGRAEHAMHINSVSRPAQWPLHIRAGRSAFIRSRHHLRSPWLAWETATRFWNHGRGGREGLVRADQSSTRRLDKRCGPQSQRSFRDSPASTVSPQSPGTHVRQRRSAAERSDDT